MKRMAIALLIAFLAPAQAGIRTIPFLGVANSEYVDVSSGNLPTPDFRYMRLMCDVSVVNVSSIAQTVTVAMQFSMLNTATSPDTVVVAAGTPSPNSGMLRGVTYRAGTATNTNTASSGSAQVLQPYTSTTGNNTLRFTRYGYFDIGGGTFSSAQRRPQICSGTITVDDGNSTTPGAVIASGVLELIAGHPSQGPKQYGMYCPGGEDANINFWYNIGESHVDPGDPNVNYNPMAYFAPVTGTFPQNANVQINGFSAVSSSEETRNTTCKNFSQTIPNNCSTCTCRRWSTNVGPQLNTNGDWVTGATASMPRTSYQTGSITSNCTYDLPQAEWWSTTGFTFKATAPRATIPQKTAGSANYMGGYYHLPVPRSNNFPQQIANLPFLINGGKPF